MKDTHIILLGEDIGTGCYLLRIELKHGRQIQFGRHNQGGAFFLPKGDYLYIGSALGEKGASSLGYRLMRHLTRCGGAVPHALRDELSTLLYNAGIPAKVPHSKTCHWHIDYLLELPEAEVTGIVILRSQADHEKQMAVALDAQPETSIPVRGLGASDHPGGTHLFYVQADIEWWQVLPKLILNITDPDDGLAKI